MRWVFRTTALPWRKRSFLIDIPIFVLGVALLYSVVAMARYWYGPLTPQVEIDLRASALPLYALYSVLRIALAYFLSLLFTLVYGYIAAYNARAERFMVPLLDVLQSIPVLSFLPGVMLAMVALFPRRQLGVEMGSILLIFTGQVWNMAFSFYSSLKNIPTEMREAARLYRFSWWQKFTQMELPFSVIGLVWNSMMSVAGGWFFLMACEMFVLGKRDFRLPGLGSYLQTAASDGNTRAIFYGVLTMVVIVVLTDQLVWRPIVAWAQKFKFENVEASELVRSPVLTLIRRSRLVTTINRKSVAPLLESLQLRFAQREEAAGAAVPVATIRRQAGCGRRHCRHCPGRLFVSGISRIYSALRRERSRIAIDHARSVCHLRARDGRACARMFVDDSRGSRHWDPSSAGQDCSALGADRRLSSRHGIVSSRRSRPGAHGRRTGYCIHPSASAGHAMVSVV